MRSHGTLLSLIAMLGSTAAQTPSIEAVNDALVLTSDNIQFRPLNNGPNTSVTELVSQINAAASAQSPISGTCTPPAAIASIDASGTVTCTNGGLVNQISQQASAASSTAAVNGGKQDRVTGTCTPPRSIASIQADGTVTCSSPQTITPCAWNAWGTWSSCSATCGGTQARTRTVRTQAVNSVPCTEFPLVQSRSCSAPCSTTTYDPCNGNERWYNLNSASTSVQVSSYVTQKVIYYSNKPADQGGKGFGRVIGTIAAGAVLTQTPTQMMVMGIFNISTGDWMCGTQGNIEVIGVVSRSEHDWVPGRMAGTVFTQPLSRSQPHIYYIMAVDQGASVDLYYGNTWQQGLYLGPGETGSFANVRRDGFSLTIRATSNVVISHIGSATNVIGTPLNAGDADYFVMTPASTAVIGIPSSGWFSRTTATAPDRNGWVYAACGNNNVRNYTLAVGARISSRYRAGQYNGYPCTVTTNPGSLVSATAIGDGDGGDGTMFLPVSKLRNQFIIPMNSEHFTVICSRSGTISHGANMNGRLASATLRGNNNGAYFAKTSGSGAGYYINSTVPCFVVADSDPDDDETVIFGM